MIPIQNLYYLLCYAWDRLPEQEEAAAVTGSVFHRPLELLTQVLLVNTRRLLRQGPAKTYVEREAELPELRGRLRLTPTLQRDLLRRGRAVCIYDELAAESAFMQLLAGTLEYLGRLRAMPAARRQEVRQVRQQLPAGLRATSLTGEALRVVRRQRPRGTERLLFNVCELIYQSFLPAPEADAQARFRDFRRDERLMASLFEAFVRNFYRHEQRRFRVLSETITWQAAAEQPADLALLPTMITDTTLENSARKIILDTKYYASALRRRYDQSRLIAPHLYQLYAYLQNQPAAPDQQLEGILLYPAAAQALDVRYTLGGHPVRIVTLNLHQPWPNIAADLLALIG